MTVYQMSEWRWLDFEPETSCCRFTLWMLVHDFHLDEQTEDDSVWKHANNGIYMAATAYKAQFLDLTLSLMDRVRDIFGS